MIRWSIKLKYQTTFCHVQSRFSFLQRSHVCGSLISSLFIMSSIACANVSMASCKSLHGNLALVVHKRFQFDFFCKNLPLKWQKIMHPSGLRFNGTFQFSSRRRFSNHHRPIWWALWKRPSTSWTTPKWRTLLFQNNLQANHCVVGGFTSRGFYPTLHWNIIDRRKS